MGTSSSKSSSKGKKVLASKLDTASKTGVLNVSECSLKGSSSIWISLQGSNFSTNLKSLDISHNDLKGLPGEVLVLSRLKTLYASSCNIQRIPDLSSLNVLEKLCLDHNDLEMESIHAFPYSLKILNLSFNHFLSLPTMISSLINLTELDLSHNRLESTIGLGGLENLLQLKLDENLISEISIDLGNLSKLQYLSLRGNKLEKTAKTREGQSIPSEVFENTALLTLDLGDNPHLKKQDIMAFSGIEDFLERRRRNKDKSLYGGALTEHSIFGLD